MAFNLKDFGVATAGAKAPSVFTYSNINDTVADMTREGYFNALAGTSLKPGDLVYATTSLGLRLLVCGFANSSAGTGYNTKFAIMAVYVGLKTAEDVAGDLAGFGGNIGAGSNSRMFTFRNDADALVDMTDNYFFQVRNELEEGDLIYCVANDGAEFIKVVTANNTAVETSNITFPVG